MADLNPQQFWHLTDNPDFALNPEHVPEDNALAIRSRESAGVYVGDPATWMQGHGYERPFLAEIHAPAEVAHDERWGGEKFIPAEHFDKAKVARVIPTDAYAREHYSDYGWAETHQGKTFDTGAPIATRTTNIDPLPGYKYDGT